MSDTVIVALLSLLGSFISTLAGILISNKLAMYRIEQLEKKVDKHNTVIERTFKLEQEVTDLKEHLK